MRLYQMPFLFPFIRVIVHSVNSPKIYIGYKYRQRLILRLSCDCFAFCPSYCGQHTCCTRDWGLQQAHQLRQQHFFRRNVCQLFNAVHVQSFTRKRTSANHQFIIGFRKVSNHFRGSYCVNRKAIDQRTSHLVSHNIKSATSDSTTSQGVFQHTQANAIAARCRAQFSHVSDRNATVFRDHERLSFCCEAVHFINDGLFLTAIKTQD